MRSLIFGGTSGLGLSLAKASLEKGIEPVIVGRRVRPGAPMDARTEFADVCNEVAVATLMNKLTVQPSLGFGYLFYTPGMFLKGDVREQSDQQVRGMMDINFFGLVNVLRHFHRMKKKPYHLVAISSTAAWRDVATEAAYGASKAAMDRYVRNFHHQLVADLPGSRTLIVHPGGMKSRFWDGRGFDTTRFMDTDLIASLIWDEIHAQALGTHDALHEVHYIRQPDGTPRTVHGPNLPELPRS